MKLALNLLFAFLLTSLNGLLAQDLFTAGWSNLSSTIQKVVWNSNPDSLTTFKASSDNRIWIATRNKLFVFWNDTLFLRTKLADPDLFISVIAIDSRQNLWIGTNNGLYIWDGKQQPLIFDLAKANFVRELLIDKNDNLFISASTIENGTTIDNYFFTINTVNLNINFQHTFKTPNRFISSLTIDKSGILWGILHSTTDSLVVFKDEEVSVTNLQPLIYSKDQLTGIAFDSQGNLWITEKSKLLHFNGLKWVTHPADSLVFQSSLGTNLTPNIGTELTGICIAESDVKWLSTKQSGLLTINAKDLVEAYNKENSPLGSNAIKSLYIDKLNRKWISSFYNSSAENLGPAGNPQQLMCFREPFAETMFNWYASIARGSNQILPHFSIIRKDRNNTLWLLNPSYGIIKVNKSAFKAYPFYNYNVLKSASMNSIAIGNQVFIGTQLGGLFCIDNNFVIPTATSRISFIKKTIIDLAFDMDDNLWIAHLTGVAKCNEYNCQEFNKNTGLLSNAVNRLFVDKQNWVWVSTSRGLSVYDQNNWHFYSIKTTDLDGVVIDLFQDKNNTLWAITEHSLFKMKDNFWVPIKADSALFQNIEITCMDGDYYGTIWLGTENHGIIKIDSDLNWTLLPDEFWPRSKSVLDLAVLDNELWVLQNSSNLSLKQPSSIEFTDLKNHFLWHSNLIILDILTK
jgi:ligand-binding sensor domain-containing protein